MRGNKCPHNRQKSRCKECGGSGVYEHGRERSQCKDCGGSGVCEHGRQRSQCKDCGGSGLCSHGRQKSKCKECVICYHGIQTYTCSVCVSKECISCSIDKKRPKHQIFEGNRNKKQKIYCVAIIAGNIKLTHYNDYWSIISFFLKLGKSDSSDFAFFEKIIHKGVENTECIEIMESNKKSKQCGFVNLDETFQCGVFIQDVFDELIFNNTIIH